MKITFVSEHASPLAALGGVDAGGQNVHVAELAKALVAEGHLVTVVTRRDDPALAPELLTDDGYRVVHVTAGPARSVPKDDLWPHMSAFSDGLLGVLAEDRPDLVHAHFWMSGWAARRAAAPLALPTGSPSMPSARSSGGTRALTTPARPRGGRSKPTSPPRSSGSSPPAPTRWPSWSPYQPPGRHSVVPCGVDVRHFTPDGRPVTGGTRDGSWGSAGWCPARASGR